MAKKKTRKTAVQTPKKTPGPKPERLVIEGDWKSAAKHALQRGKPTK